MGRGLADRELAGVAGQACLLKMVRYPAARASFSAGVPVVLLHGLGGTHAVWNVIVPAVSAGREVFAFDLPGHGESPLDADRGMASQAVAGIFQCLDAAGVTQMHLCGHSLGGAVACVMALRQPERVASLTLLAPGGFGTELNRSALEAFVSARSGPELRAALKLFTGACFEPSPQMLEDLAAQRGDPAKMERLRRSVAMVAEANARRSLPLEEVAGTGMPVTVLWGADDIITPYEQSFGLPDAFEVKRYPGTGHMLIDEIPVEVIGVLLRQTGAT